MRGAKKKTIFLSFSFFLLLLLLVVKRSTFPDDRKKKMVIKRNQETVAVDFRLSRSLAQVLSSLVGKIKKKRKKVTRRG